MFQGEHYDEQNKGNKPYTFYTCRTQKRLLCLTLSLQVVRLKQAYVKVVLRLY